MAFTSTTTPVDITESHIYIPHRLVHHILPWKREELTFSNENPSPGKILDKIKVTQVKKN